MSELHSVEYFDERFNALCITLPREDYYDRIERVEKRAAAAEAELENKRRAIEALQAAKEAAEQRARELEAKIADLPMRWREFAETIAPTAAAVQCRWHAQEIERILAKHQSDRAVEESKSPSRQDS